MAAFARVVNANPSTGSPAVLGEVATSREELETFGRPFGSLTTTSLVEAFGDAEGRGRLLAAVPASPRPTEWVLELGAGGWRPIETRPLRLSAEADLRFHHAQWQAGAVDALHFLAALPEQVVFQCHVRLETEGVVPLLRGAAISGRPATGILVSDDVALSPHRPGTAYVVLVERVEARHMPLLSDPLCAGVLAVRGSRADHFALLAKERSFGYMALTGHRIAGSGLECGDRSVTFGTVLTVDFGTGDIYTGRIPTVRTDGGPLVDDVTQLLARHPSPVPLRLNADVADDVPLGLPPDVAGIGLVRTEHMLLRRDRGELVTRALQAAERDGPAVAAEVRAFFEPEMDAMLAQAGERPVTVRLLDQPLHELAAPPLQEVNPMLGLRGVRQGIRSPWLYRGQIEAILRAASRAKRAAVEILVPMLAAVEEMRLVRAWVDECRAALGVTTDVRVPVGAMIETPAALLVAGPLAAECDFLSFGTNDLTQLVLGLSREDYPSFLGAYRRHGVFTADPFEELHPTVTDAIEDAARRARRANPAVVLGLCGDHAASRRVLELARTGVLDYVSVVPADLRIAHLRALSLLRVAGP